MLKLELFCSTGGIPGEEFAASDSPSATERSSYFRIRGPETQRPILPPSPPRFPRVHESEGGRERNGRPYLIFTPSFITLPLHFSGGALSWATSKCLRRRSLQFYLYFEYGSGSESQGPDSHFGQNLGLAMEHWIRSLAIEHVSFGKCRQDRPSSVGHLTC